MINHEKIYLCLVSEKDYPIGPLKYRPMEVTTPVDADAEDWESFSNEFADWNDGDDSHEPRNRHHR
ncbi:MAG TPA: hypothetical protein V6C69_01530 [Trichormus sp.]